LLNTPRKTEHARGDDGVPQTAGTASSSALSLIGFATKSTARRRSRSRRRGRRRWWPRERARTRAPTGMSAAEREQFAACRCAAQRCARRAV